MRSYHDLEWGRPVADDGRLFEKLSLEGFLSGLSWLTIRASADISAGRSGPSTSTPSPGSTNAAWPASWPTLASCATGPRSRRTVNNARRCIDLVDEVGSLAGYVWRFEPDAANRPTPLSWQMVQSTSPEATAMSKDLKRRVWVFVGPTNVYGSCRPWASSTTTCPAASLARRLNRRAVLFGGPVRPSGHGSA